MQARHILIAGAGIGGLASALACHRAGHQVQVFEKSAQLAALGAGIQLGPNVTRILHRWGLQDALRQTASFPEALTVRSAQTGANLGQLRLGKTIEQRYSAPYATLHRADLQSLLVQALQQSGGPAVELATGVESLTQDASGVHATLQSNNGARPLRHADLLVGADGLWSRVRALVNADGAPVNTGHVAYRCLLRLDDLPPGMRRVLAGSDLAKTITVWLGPKLHVVHYPVHGGQWLNLVLILETPQEPGSADWAMQVNPAELARDLKPLALFTPLRDLLLAPVDQLGEKSDLGQDGHQGVGKYSWQKWQLHRRAPLRSWRQHASGRVVLVGDAAHPMLPYLAQGAGMAIEDADALALSLQGEASVPLQLESFARTRWQRNARVQARSMRNGEIFHASGMVRWGRDVAMKLLGERLLDLPWLYEKPEQKI